MPSKKLSNVEIGRLGENAAVAFLRARGIIIIRQNVRTPYGEIDILCREDEVLVFAEVKTRRSMRFGHPEAAVDARKQQHMIDSANAYLQENEALEQPWRIDVIAVNFNSALTPRIKWYKNAITC